MRRCVPRKEHSRTGGVVASTLVTAVLVALIFAAPFGGAFFLFTIFAEGFLVALVIIALDPVCAWSRSITAIPIWGAPRSLACGDRG